jgi:hypothetical protein
LVPDFVMSAAKGFSELALVDASDVMNDDETMDR